MKWRNAVASMALLGVFATEACFWSESLKFLEFLSQPVRNLMI
jgi:hypothetical protein